MDISQCYCPNRECEDYGKKEQGNIVCYETYGKHKTNLRLIPPGQVKLLGKGRKQRACPLWPETIDADPIHLYGKYF